MLRRRRRSMSILADEAMHGLRFALVADGAVADASESEEPWDAGVGLGVEHEVEEAGRFATLVEVRCSERKAASRAGADARQQAGATGRSGPAEAEGVVEPVTACHGEQTPAVAVRGRYALGNGLVHCLGCWVQWKEVYAWLGGPRDWMRLCQQGKDVDVPGRKGWLISDVVVRDKVSGSETGGVGLTTARVRGEGNGGRPGRSRVGS